MSPIAHAPQITEPLQSACSEQMFEDSEEFSSLLDSEDGGTREVEVSLEFSLVLELEVSEHTSFGQLKPTPGTRVQTLLIQSTISHVFKHMILDVS